MELILEILGIVLIGWIGVGLCWIYARQIQMIDVPNERSSHTQQTPRGGGMGFVVPWIGGISYAILQQTLPVALGSALLACGVIALLGWWDDHRALSVRLRFFAQIATAIFAVLILFLHAPPHPWLTALTLPLLIFACVWSTNLFNFMDGTDGIAAIEGMSVLAGGAWLLQVHQAPPAIVWSCMGLVALLGGFFIWNYPRAKIFMGDVGSGFLGFLVAILSLISAWYYHISLWYWIVLYSVFWIDATLTLLRRIYCRERWTQPHRSHAYQRLHQMGWTHAAILYSVLCVNIGLIGVVWVGWRWPDAQLALSVIVLTILIALYGMILQRSIRIQGQG